MADEGPLGRRTLVRAWLRLLSLVLSGCVILSALHHTGAGLDWNGWVVGGVSLLVSAAGWVVWGTRPAGWMAASLLTWVVHLACTTALFMWAEFGVASFAGGLVYGSIWTVGLLVPVGVVSLIPTEPPAEPQWR